MTNPTPAEQKEPAQVISLQGPLARATLGVGLVAASMGMIARDEQTALGTLGAFVGAVAVLMVAGRVAQNNVGRVIDHLGKGGEDQWKEFSETRFGRVISNISTGKLASLLTTLPFFVAGVQAAEAMTIQGPTLGNVALAMTGAVAWVGVNTVLERLRILKEPQEEDKKPTRPRMR